MAQRGSKGHSITCQAIWHFLHLPMWMAPSSQLTAAAWVRSRRTRVSPGYQGSKEPGQQPQSFVVQHHDAKTNNLTFILPRFLAQLRKYTGGFTTVFPSEVSCNHTLHRNAVPLKYVAVSSLSLGSLQTSRILPGHGKHEGGRRGIRTQNDLFSIGLNFIPKDFFSYWVIICLLRFKALHFVSYQRSIFLMPLKGQLPRW